MNTYYELLIKINPEIADVVSEICFDCMPCEGVVLAEETRDDAVILSTTEGTLKVFLTSDCDVGKILTEQRNLLKDRGLSDDELGSWEFSYQEKDNQDWSKKWKEKWDITHVTDRIVVVPDWLTYEAKESDIVIKMEPGSAFGTGTHATTQLCMLAIEKYVKAGDTVADIGTGSGILSVCAKKFGASFAYGCDIDETVIDIAKDNARKNEVDCVFEFNSVDNIKEKFSFVTANILHNVLAEIMPDLVNIMEDGAVMVLSGILDEKKDVVIDAICQCGLKILEQNYIDQWTSFIVRR